MHYHHGLVAFILDPKQRQPSSSVTAFTGSRRGAFGEDKVFVEATGARTQSKIFLNQELSEESYSSTRDRVGSKICKA